MRRIFIVLMTAAVTVTACAGDGGGEASGTTSADASRAATDGAERGESEEAMADDGSEVDVDLDAADRRVIRMASLELRAAHTRETFDDIVAMVESVGGFVAHANVFPTSGEDEQPVVSMTLRVPADELNSTMAAIKDSVDEVVAESQGAEDVTEQFIDLEARLTNLEALETELRALLEEVRMQDNADPQKILSVFNELSSVRGQIEQIQGQLNYLDDATTLATLEIQLTPTPAAVPIVEEPWSPAEASRDALRSLVNGLQGAADCVINFALYALPMLLITVGPLLVIGIFVYRRFFRRPPTAGATPVES